MAAETPDRIEKKVLLRAPRARVWRALTDTKEFCAWFGIKFDEPFAPKKAMRGAIVGTAVDAEVARMQQQHKHVPFAMTIEEIVPERLFSFRWHPNAVEPGVDYTAEPTTLITFTLEEVSGGTLLTVVESGFNQIPLARRAKAFGANQAGWTIVVGLIEKHLAHAA